MTCRHPQVVEIEPVADPERPDHTIAAGRCVVCGTVVKWGTAEPIAQVGTLAQVGKLARDQRARREALEDGRFTEAAQDPTEAPTGTGLRPPRRPRVPGQN